MNGINEPVGGLGVAVKYRGVLVTMSYGSSSPTKLLTAAQARSLASWLESAASELERNDLSRCDLAKASDFPCGGFVETIIGFTHKSAHGLEDAPDPITVCEEHRRRMLQGIQDEIEAGKRDDGSREMWDHR